MDTSISKRQKVTTACDPCRSRKVKCDGHQPVCGPCEKRHNTVYCTWITDPLRAPLAPPTDYVRRLEERIKLLEGRNIQDHQNLPSISPSWNNAPEDSVPRVPSSHGGTISNSPASTTWQPTVMWGGSSFTSTPRTSTDSRPSNPITLVVPGLGPSSKELPGSTSVMFNSNTNSVHDVVLDDSYRNESVSGPIARNFLQEVERIVTEKVDVASPPASSILNRSRDTSIFQVSSHELRQRDLDYALPDRAQADSLLNSYWNYVHVIYPFLDKSQIEEDYVKIWGCDNSNVDRRPILCLLNSIFAISSRQVRSATPNHEHSASVFCMRARGLLNIEACSIRAVQSYLLLALYFQSTLESRTCWVFVGLAIRTAQMLELDLLETSEWTAENSRRDLLRKVWHGCVLMDREVSMLCGRLSMIDPKAASAVLLPLALEEETLQMGNVGARTTQVSQTHTAEFFKSYLGLYDILHDVLLNSRSSKSHRHFKNGIYDSEDVLPLKTNTSIIQLQDRLSKWERSIPDYFKVGHHSPYTSMNVVLVRRAVVLHQRHLHVHLLLLTPILQRFVTSEFRDSGKSIPFGSLLSHRISLQCAIVSVRIAQEAIDTIYIREAIGSNEMRDLSAWWYNAIFLYKSATVLIAGSLCPSVVAEVSEASIHDSFHKATAILRQYTTFNASFCRLTITLDILFQIIPQKFSRLKRASQRAKSNTGQSTSADDNTAPTFQYWCPVRPTPRVSSTSQDTEMHSSSENNTGPSQLLLDLDHSFDLDDFTWLMKMPFST